MRSAGRGGVIGRTFGHGPGCLGPDYWGYARHVFQKLDFQTGQTGGSTALWLNRGITPPDSRIQRLRERAENWAHDIDLVPDLGRNIGSRTWWRGLATCTCLCATMILLSPGIQPVPAPREAPLGTERLDQYRAQMVGASALGGDSGIHMGPTDAAAPLAQTPERPQIELDAALGAGGFARTLARAGVGERDAQDAMALIATAVDPASIGSGTHIRLVLGRRTSRDQPRPLEKLNIRAKLELALEVARQDGVLALRKIPIAVDATPLRLRGAVGPSLYRSARAAGADPATIQAYLKVIATRLDVGDIGADDRFDIIVAHRRAATGERETGALLFAGLERRGKPINMLKWTQGDRAQWFEASGVGEQRAALAQPVAGRVSSNFGRRFHPILGYSRLHAGMDIAAPWGTPIYAVTDGRVAYAGWHGGHGKYVRIQHGGNIATGYAHMSRIAARQGESVRRGQVIGYVGSTGLSTGPHLHYELYRGGVAINPASMKFTRTAQLAGRDLAAFRARLAQLKSLPAGLAAQTPQVAVGIAAHPQASSALR